MERFWSGDKMRTGMIKTTIREIKSSFGRYMAILLIVALGVGFFVGLKITHDVMVHTADTYLGELELYDYRLVSAIGFDEGCESAFEKEKDVKTVEGSKSADILMEREDGSERVIKTMALSRKVNMPRILAGRMPETDAECLADSHAFGKSDIGSKIRISEANVNEDIDKFKVKEYTITGIVTSPLYIRYDRGNTSIGNGVIDAFIYIEQSAYNMDYDTEVYVVFEKGQDGERKTLVEDNAVIYSDEYEKFMEGKKEKWEEIADSQAKKRYDRICRDARKEIADARQELGEEKAEAEEKLADARQEIEDGKKKLSDGEAAIASAKRELAQNEKKLADSEKQYKEGEAEYKEGKEKYDAGKKAYDKAKAQYDAEYAKNYPEYEKNLEIYNAGKAAYEQSVREYEQAFAGYEAGKLYLSAAEQQQKETELAAWKAALEKNSKALEGAKAQLEAAAAGLEAGAAKLEAAQKELKASAKELASAKKTLDSAKTQIADGKRQLADARSQIAVKEQEISDAWIELADGEEEYQEGERELAEKTAGAEEKIADAEEELANLEQPDSYVLDRNTNSGYVNFETDSEIVMGIANVFPIFFFLVAALVCITTMTRMLEEQRTQMGVLKALGYSNGAIVGKYMAYSVSASLTGAVAGFLFGTKVFPWVIWRAYGMMYNMGDSYYVFDRRLAVVSLVVAFLCSGGTTLLCCYQELSENAAGLMRPKAPKAGKRVMLERIPAIWRRLRFLDKVSVRNLFRYKKRFFMMIIGVSGCTALLVAAFGIRDSISNIADKQFGEIFVYDMSVNMKEETDCADWGIEQREDVSDCLPVLKKSVDVLAAKGSKSVNLLIPEHTEDFASYMTLISKAGERLTFPKEGEVYISEKLSERYRIEIGDSITIEDSDLRSGKVTVSGIFENYFNQCILLTGETYASLFGEEAVCNMAFVNVGEKADVHEVSAALMQLDEVTNVSVSGDIRQNMADMMASLDYVVFLVIGCAGALAFIVIYNLNNINITERIREIATIKVLGFYKEETKSYIFRENVVLTLLGSLVGLVLGHYLHAFIMSEINLDDISFDVNIRGTSYLLSVVGTLAFNWLVNLFMSGKLEKVQMAESLKSVD